MRAAVPARARKGATASRPSSGFTVTASAPQMSKRARAYASAVLPMSPRLASRISSRLAGTIPRTRSGMLVNVGSIGGKVVLPWMTLYSVTKSALGTLTEGQRMELMGDGVRTMLVCPGYVKTGFQKNVRAGQSPEKVQKARRFAITPEQCAEAIRRGVERDAR